jgi:hypothetical protein
MDQKFNKPIYPNQMVYKAYYYNYEDKPYYVSTYYSEKQPMKEVLVKKHYNYFYNDIKYFILIFLLIFLLWL